MALTSFILFGLWLAVLGTITYALGIFGLLKPPFLLLACLPPAYYLVRYIKQLHTHTKPLSGLEKALIAILMIQFLVYSLGLFIPETGFDALWYHLPEAQVYATTGKIAKIPELLYSTMPRLGEMYFADAWLFFHSLWAVKLVAFFFSFLFILTSYFLSRRFLTRPQSLLAAAVIASMFLFAWQSASAYVDLIAAFFQLLSLLCLLKFFDIKPVNRLSDYRLLILSALFTGLATSVKIQALIGLFALSITLAFVLWRLRISVANIILHTSFFILLAIIIATPWYLDNFLQSGHPLYPTNLVTLQQAALNHAGASSLPGWLLRQTSRLPLLLWDLTFQPRDYLSPIFLILLPTTILRFFIKKKPPLHVVPLLLFVLVYLFLWWFLPPPETRYVLAALPPLIILELWAVFTLPERYLNIKNWTVVFVFLTIFLNLTLRLGAGYKYLPVILSRQTPAEYIQSQTTDFNRPIIEKFYSGYWLNYRYP